MSKYKLLFAGFVLMLVQFACRTYDCVPVQEYSKSLKSFELSDGIQGQFFLASGTVSNVSSYSYYEIQEDGGAVRVTIPADKAIIYEVEDTEPHVEFYHGGYENGSGGCIMKDLPKSLDHFDSYSSLNTSHWYQIYVLPGTIAELSGELPQ